MLSGSSLAGGLRSYIADRLFGYGKEEPRPEPRPSKPVADLFGGTRGDDEGGQSPLIVFDGISRFPENRVTEIRDGVAIHAPTGLAEDHKKFDLEVLPPGTTFPIRFELLIAEPATEVHQVSVLVEALSGLEQGEIPIGARRSRGLGACRAKCWRAQRFDLATEQGWLDWLRSDYLDPLGSMQQTPKIAKAVETAYPKIALHSQQDKRTRIRITAHLTLDTGLLVRSPGTEAADADVTHLSSGGKPVVPGTSLAGVMRARALRIARVVRDGKGDAEKWINDLFGPRLAGTTDPNYQPHESRLRITEKPVQETNRLRPNRIRIDRFTGGVVDGALFDEEPVYGGKVEVVLELRNPRPGETGLVLLLLKDLLTGDLPVGGTTSVGRGVLKGTATVQIGDKNYTLDPAASADSETVSVLNEKVTEFLEVGSLTEGVPEEEAV